MSEYPSHLPAPLQPPIGKAPKVRKHQTYTSLSWQELIQQARDNVKRRHLEPSAPLETQGDTPATLQFPIGTGLNIEQFKEALHEQSCHPENREFAAWSLKHVECDYRNKQLVFKRGQEDVHHFFRLWHARKVDKSLRGSLRQNTNHNRQIEVFGENSPGYLFAIGERPTAALTASHTSGYTFRPRPARAPESASTRSSRRSRVPPPILPPLQSVYDPAPEAEAFERVGAIGNTTQTTIDHASDKLPQVSSEHPTSRESHDGIFTQPSQAFTYVQTLPLRLASPPQQEGIKSSKTLIIGRHEARMQLPPTPTSMSDKPRLDLPKADDEAYHAAELLLQLRSDDSGVETTGSLSYIDPSELKPSHKKSQIWRKKSQMPVQPKGVLPEGQARCTKVEANGMSSTSNNKRKAVEEPQGAPLSKHQRKKQNKRARQAAAENANSFITAAESATRVASTDARPNYLDLDIAQTAAKASHESLESTLATQAEIIQWHLLGDDDRKRLLEVGFVPPPKPEPVLKPSRKERREKRLEKCKERMELEKPTQLAKPTQLEKPTQLRDPDTEAKTRVEVYRNQREGRRALEERVEGMFAETEEVYVKIEGEDGKPQYVAWKDIKMMDMGWMQEA